MKTLNNSIRAHRIILKLRLRNKMKKEIIDKENSVWARMEKEERDKLENKIDDLESSIEKHLRSLDGLEEENRKLLDFKDKYINLLASINILGNDVN